jgi:predicted ATPase
MLTRLEVDGFKSFEGMRVDLAPFTVILGNNAAGKSNLFDVIQFLSRLAERDVVEAMKGLRGEPLELFRQTPGGRCRQIWIAAEVLLDPLVRDPWGSEVRLTHTRMRYEVVLERRETKAGLERIQVAREQVTPILRKEDRWADAWVNLGANRGANPGLNRGALAKGIRSTFLKYARTRPWLTTDQNEEGLAFNIHQDGKQGRTRPANAAEATVLYSITNAEFPHLFALREEMRGWRLLQLDPALLRRPAPVTAPGILSPDGANLAAVLAELKAETRSRERPNGVLSEIAAELNHLIPGITRLDASLHEASREYRIELTMRDGLPYSSRVISDGTLRVLALLTLLYDPRHRGLICFEEPENGVHPGRIRQLIQRLRELVSWPEAEPDAGADRLTQLLLNSHSPVVLSALLDRDLAPLEGTILFADSAGVSDPGQGETRRKTRLRPVVRQAELPLHEELPVVSPFEVRKILDTVSLEG